ncbi:MAG: hypothetical protein ACM3Q1_03875 [Bacteroidales bacterium]
MESKSTAFAAAAFGLCLGAVPLPAAASQSGILACQITLSEFAEDVAASKPRLNPNQLSEAREVVDVGRSQCRSTPQLVWSDIRAARTAMRLPTSGHPSYRFSDFWPATPQEMASLTR